MPTLNNKLITASTLDDVENPAWFPNPKQTAALERPEYEVLYGGARGGGKTDAGLVWMLKCITIPRFRGLVIRKNADDLGDWLDRANRLYSQFGAEIVGKPATIRFPSGAKIKVGHLRDDQAYTKYQGHEYQRMLIEEVTQIPDEKRYLKLTASCRSTIKGLPARVFLTTNPGGVGHSWVKKRFIDVGPWGERFLDKTSKRSRIFIHATLDDNPQLMDNDPDYIGTLEALKDTDVELWKAWRLGDWDTFAGQFFREFRRDLHVMKPFEPKRDLAKIGGLDWGRAAPFAMLGSIVFPVKYIDPKTETEYNFIRCITYKEVYGTDKKPSEWSDEIGRVMRLDQFKWIQCDNQIFTQGNDKSMSIFEQFCASDKRFRSLMKAGTKDRVGGWVNMHNWLSIAPDGLPYWLITENCQNLIRTIPELIHDEVNIEDVDTSGEDHAPDAMRYQFSGFKWIDGKLGGVKTKTSQQQKQQHIKAPININLDKFADPKQTQYTNR